MWEEPQPQIRGNFFYDSKNSFALEGRHSGDSGVRLNVESISAEQRSY